MSNFSVLNFSSFPLTLVPDNWFSVQAERCVNKLGTLMLSLKLSSYRTLNGY